MDETKIIEKILNEFRLSTDKFNELNNGSTDFVKGFWNGKMDDDCKKLFCYLEGLDGTLDEYYQFGADKAGVNDFKQFCEKLNIDTKQTHNIKERGNHLYSRDKKLMITFSSKNANETGYFHYFGVTGGRKEVLYAYDVFTTMGDHSGMCYGGREFI